MKPIALSLLTMFALGCRELGVVDTIPPEPPRGIRSLALDNEVELDWIHNTENDLAGYHIWSSDRYDGRYELIGTTSSANFNDMRAQNGATYYYAVSAFDFNENESDLSYQEVSETPRPEGFKVLLFEASAVPEKSGYDFSTYSVGRFDDRYTDFFYEKLDSNLNLSVWSDTDIQDVGFAESFDDIRVAPSSGWSPTRTTKVIRGHTYVVWTWDNHFAKVRITDLTPTKIVFDWSYQLVDGNRHLKSTRPLAERMLLSR
jgi:hypothetical protein